MTAYFAPDPRPCSLSSTNWLTSKVAALPPSPSRRLAQSCWKPYWKKPPNWPPRCWRRSTSRATCRVPRSALLSHYSRHRLHLRRIEASSKAAGTVSAARGTRRPRLPELFNTATQEMWNSANMSFALCPMLNAGAIEAISHAGSAEQRALYLPNMVSGEWTGTMNLTEPQAGPDLSAVRTRAVPQDDHYRIFGQKIFITWAITT